MGPSITNNNQGSAKVTRLTASKRSNRFGIDDSGRTSFTYSSPKLVTVELWIDVLSRSCNLCNKLLHGKDIFMYKGEKWFCSEECREKQMRSDGYTDNDCFAVKSVGKNK